MTVRSYWYVMVFFISTSIDKLFESWQAVKMSGDLLRAGSEETFHMSKICVTCHVLFFTIGLNYKSSSKNFLLTLRADSFFFSPSLLGLNKWLKLTRARRKHCNLNSSSLLTYFPASGAVTDQADISHIKYVNKKTFPLSSATAFS